MISAVAKGYKVNWLLASLLLLHSGLLVAANSRSSSSEEPCLLTIGMSNWLPYQAVEKDAEPVGLQVELLNQIFKLADCKLRYKSMPFPMGLDELESGGIDFMMNATPSEYRRSFANFSIPYRVEFQVLYSTKTYLAKCQSMTLEELIRDGFRLAVERRVIYGDALRKIQQTPELDRKLHYVNNIVQHVELVKKERLDGVIDDPVVMSYRSVVHKTGKLLSACPIQISSSPVSLMFSKKTVSPQVVERFNQVIRQLQKTPEYKKQWSW